MVTALKPLIRRYERHYEASAGADFIDGGIDYLRRTAGIGLSNGTQGTISFWVKRSSSASSQSPVYLNCGATTGTSAMVIKADASGYVYVTLRDGAGGVIIFAFQSAGLDLPRDDRWHHVLISWDTNYAAGLKKKHLYIDGIDVLSGTVNDPSAAFTLPYNVNDWCVSNTTVRTSSAYIDGGVSEYWFDDSYMDFSLKANRRKFISSSNRPVILGSDGSKPTGSQPPIYFKGIGTGFNVNSGSGGNFTTTGTLNTPTDTPSTQPPEAPSTDMEAMDGATMEAMDGTTMEAMDA